MSTSIFELVQLVAGNVWLYGGSFLLVLGVLVFIHEWGHYIVARWCGVRIESFSIGFGKELFGITDKRGTRWKFSLVPLGGYVKMFGDVDPASAGHDDTTKDEETDEIRPLNDDERKVAFFHQPVWQRAAIVFAGPLINFIFAIFVLAGLFMFYGQPVTPPIAAGIMADSAAYEAGFMPHDEVIAIDNQDVRRFEDIRREVMVGLDTTRDFKVLRDGSEVIVPATPRVLSETDRFGFKQSKGLLGIIGIGHAIQVSSIKVIDGQDVSENDNVHELLMQKMGAVFSIGIVAGEDKIDTVYISPSKNMNTALTLPEDPGYNHLILAPSDDASFIKHGIASALKEAVIETKGITMNTLEALTQMVTGTRSATELGGIIRIGAIAGDMAKAGIISLVTFTALLSINLGLINLFPIPMLDGGHLLFYLIETVKGSPIKEQTQEYAFRLGLAILVGIMLFANVNDIVQMIQGIL